MSVNLTQIYQLLKNAGHHDNDTRYMATHDLITELEKVDVLDQSLQIRIRQAIIQQLDDKNTDVQTVAVRCLSTLVRKFDSAQVADIVDKLGSLVADAKQEANRDVYGIGLRTCIVALKPEDGRRLAGALTKHLLIGLRQSVTGDGAMQAVCLDILKELLSRLGAALVGDYDAIVGSLSGLLESKRPALTKRASFALGELARHLGESAFQKLVAQITNKLQENSNNIAYIQTISLICQSAGVRVGRHLKSVIPALERTFASSGAGGERWQLTRGRGEDRAVGQLSAGVREHHPRVPRAVDSPPAKDGRRDAQTPGLRPQLLLRRHRCRRRRDG